MCIIQNTFGDDNFLSIRLILLSLFFFLHASIWRGHFFSSFFRMLLEMLWECFFGSTKIVSSFHTCFGYKLFLISYLIHSSISMIFGILNPHRRYDRLFALNDSKCIHHWECYVIFISFPLYFFPSFSIPWELVKLYALSQHYSLWRGIISSSKRRKNEDEKSIGSKMFNIICFYPPSYSSTTLLQYIRSWKLVSFFVFDLFRAYKLKRRGSLCARTCCNAFHVGWFGGYVGVETFMIENPWWNKDLRS